MCTKPVSPKVHQTIIPSAKTGGSRKHTVNTQGQGGRWAAANQHASSAFHYPTCVPHTRKTRTPRPSRAPSPPCLLPFPFYTPRHHSLLHTTTAPAPAPKREEEDASCPTAAPLPPPSLSLSLSIRRTGRHHDLRSRRHRRRRVPRLPGTFHERPGAPRAPAVCCGGTLPRPPSRS